MSKRGKLLGIAIKPAPKAPMNKLSSARVTMERGVEDDARGNPGRRQVTVITRSSWETACLEVGAGEIPWTARRANLLVDGIDLKNKIGCELKIGNVVLMINGETRPCERMKEVHPKLMTALQPEWRGGVICSVSRSGDIAVGGEVVLRQNPARRLSHVTYNRARQLVKSGRGILSDVARRLGLRPQKSRQPETSKEG